MDLDCKKSEYCDDLLPDISPKTYHIISLEELKPLDKARKHFLKFFLDIGFYLCVIPYKIVQAEECTYKKKSYRIQQILCLAVHFTAALDMATHLRAAPYVKVSEHPKMYFDIFVIMVHLTVILTFCYSMWTNSQCFCWLVKVVQNCPIISLWYPKKINLIMVLITLEYVIMALLNPLFGDVYGYTWSRLLHASRGRYLLFLSSESPSTKWNYAIQNKTATVLTTNENNASFEATNIMFALFSYFSSTSQWIVIYHADLIVNVMALTLWSATTFFTSTLKEQSCKQVVCRYESLKKLSGCINSVAGTIVLTYTVDCILYYATNMESLFTGKNWFSKLVVLQFLVSSVSWLHFASCACLQMDKFREWVRQKENRSALPTKSISIILLLDEIATNTVGLSGNGLFTINYKFVAKALTTVMTYFILVIQFK